VNLSLPLWGEFYLDGHLAAVIIGFLLYGSLVGAIETQYAKARSDKPTFATLFVPVYSAYQFFLLRGSLLSATAYLVPIILCMRFCTTRSRESWRPEARANEQTRSSRKRAGTAA